MFQFVGFFKTIQSLDDTHVNTHTKFGRPTSTDCLLLDGISDGSEMFESN